MRVKELIEKLNSFDPNLRVVTPGFDESQAVKIEVPLSAMGPLFSHV
jgi:hypothetical protein